MYISAGALSPDVDLTEQTIIVTGGTGVLGRVLVTCLVQSGANIALVVRDIEKAQLLFPASEVPNERFLVVAANVNNSESHRAARDQCLDRFSRIDALVNGAGGNLPETTTSAGRRFVELAQPRRCMKSSNLTVGYNPACQVFAEPMARQGKSAIVNITSMNALRR